MPSLVLLGQKTCVAGDDLFLTGVLFIAIRLLQLAVLIPLSVLVDNDNQEYGGCPDEDSRHDLLSQSYPIFVSYITFSYVLVVLGMILQVGIMRASVKGTPTQPEKRTNVRRLCHCNLIPLSVIRVLTITLGLLSAHILKDYCDCQPDPSTKDLFEEECEKLNAYRTYFVILVSTHIAEGLLVAMIVFYFVCKCTPSPPALATAETKWNVCCHCCMSLLSCATCCCLGGRELGDYSDIAMVLADYFDDEGTLDIVTSDVVVALLMLLRVQDERREACVLDVLTRAQEYQEQDKYDDMNNSYSSAKEVDAIRNEAFVDAGDEEKSTDSDENSIDSAVARLALAELKQSRSRPLAESLVFQLDRTESGGRVYFRPTARAVLMANNPVDKLAIAEGARFMRYARAMYSWKMDLLEKPVPSCVTFGSQAIRSMCSKKTENIVGDNLLGLHVRSLESFAKLEPGQVVYASFVEGIGKSPFCVVLDHEWKSVVISIRGTLSLEDAVTDISIRPVSLEECGTRCGFDGRLCYAHAGMLATSEWIYNEIERIGLLDELLLKEDASCVGYKLRVTGHSLGAGCASVLAIMLRPKFPDLRALCFSPPGCVISDHLAERCKDYMTSYVLDNDIVPRLSQESMENLRDDVLEMIARIKVPKRSAVIASRGRGDGGIDKILYSKESIPPSKFSDELNGFRRCYEKRKEDRTMINVRLSPPGNIVHMVKTGFKPENRLRVCHSPEEFYTARWVEADDLCEIIISARILDDHNPLNVLTELKHLATEFGMSSPFTIGALGTNNEAS